MTGYKGWAMALGLGAVLAASLAPVGVSAATPPAERLAAVNGQVAQFLSTHTKMSALIAENLPTVQTMVPLYVTANVEATASSYSVQYWDVTRPEPVNRHASARLASANTHLLTISGTAYASPRLATDAVAQHLAPFYRTLSGERTSVPLIPGFDASYYPQTKLLTWQEGDWTIEVRQGSKTADMVEGQHIITALDRWALPPFPGIMTASQGSPSSEVYALAFADGSAVYQINPFYNHAPHARYGLKAPQGMQSPADLVEAANSLVPTTSFYNPTVAQITIKVSPPTVHAGQYAMISGQLLNQYGKGAAYSPFSMTGLPQNPSYINGTANRDGRFSMRIFFPHAGTYVIGAGDGLVGTDVTVHVLPALWSSFAPAVVRDALKAIAGKTTLPLNGPFELPPRASGYLTARAEALLSLYTVFVINTTRPLGINSPMINDYLTAKPMVAQFSEMRLRAKQPRPGAPNYLQYLAKYNPRFVSQPSTAASGTLNLGLGIDASVYPVASTAKALLVWQEGDWTVEIQGGSAARERIAALPVVAYLHKYFLPPYPGIVAVQLTGQNTAWTQVDWMHGHVMSTVSDPTPSPNNAVDTVEMATHWNVP